MKVIQVTEKQQKIVRSIRCSRGNMRNQMLNNPIAEETAGKKRGNQVMKTGVSTEERKEIATGIRKNKEKKV